MQKPINEPYLGTRFRYHCQVLKEQVLDLSQYFEMIQSNLEHEELSVTKYSKLLMHVTGDEPIEGSKIESMVNVTLLYQKLLSESMQLTEEMIWWHNKLLMHMGSMKDDNAYALYLISFDGYVTRRLKREASARPDPKIVKSIRNIDFHCDLKYDNHRVRIGSARQLAPMVSLFGTREKVEMPSTGPFTSLKYAFKRIFPMLEN